MNIAIIGSGVVGLTLAKELLSTSDDIHIDLIDSFSIPSKGTSIRNSGVLHAGLYYEPGSLKSKLCVQGRELLTNYMVHNDLPLLQCGKLLVPHSQSDIQRLHDIKSRADQNGCITELLDHKDAEAIQPGLCSRDVFLWSPKTSVFSPADILNHLVAELVDSQRVSFILSSVDYIDPCTGKLKGPSLNADFTYDFIYNVSGPGALNLFKKISDAFNHLFLVPFIGEYARLETSLQITTNIYPVPDPNLPFLGVHVTPQLYGRAPIIGPNALPFFRSYLDEYIQGDLTNLTSRLLILLGFFASNSSNFRSHSFSEFTFTKVKKFSSRSSKFFQDNLASNFHVSMDSSIYGIRPQLVDLNQLSFANDFICQTVGKTLHVINAISPAFTSSFALARYLTSFIP